LPSYDDHISQAKSNLSFLESINNDENDNWDWQVTVAFYSALHLINAHTVKTTGQSFRTHKNVDHQINPFGNRPASLPNDIYLAYEKLSNLSRRSRYLCHDKHKSKEGVFFTHDTHFAKSIKCLDKILDFMRDNYDVKFDQLRLRCIDLKKASTKNYEAVDHL